MVGKWEPLTFQYQSGQINFPGFDHWVLVEQDISPLLSRKLQRTSKDVIRYETAVLDREANLLTHQLTGDLKTLFNEWYYWHSKVLLQDTILAMMYELEPLVDIRYENGEIDVLEYELFRQQISSASNIKWTVEQKRLETEWQIRMITYLPESVDMIPRAIDRMGSADTILIQQDTALLDELYENRTDVLDARIEETRLQIRKPEYRLGYFYQTLQKEQGYQGFQVTMGIPIDQRVGKIRSQQLELERQQVQFDWDNRRTWMAERTRALRTSLEQLRTSIVQYESESVDGQTRLLNVAKGQLQLGEIDLFEFNQTQKLVFEKQNERLDLIRMYNQKMIQLNFLSILN